MQQAELHAAQLEAPTDLTAYMAASSHDLHAILAKVATPLGMQPYVWSSWVECKLAGCPQHDRPDGVRGWQRLVNGFEGNVLAETDDGKPWIPLSNWDEMIAILGRVIFSQQQLRQRL